MLTASWRPALIALNLLLLAMIAFFGARIASAMIAARLAAPPARAITAAAPAAPSAAAEPESAYAMIAERDVFNAVKRQGAEPGAATEAYKRTDLNLKLWGTALAHDPAESFAIIEDQAARLDLPRRGTPVRYLPTNVVTVVPASAAWNVPLVTATGVPATRFWLADVTVGVIIVGAVPPVIVIGTVTAAVPLLTATTTTVPSVPL